MRKQVKWLVEEKGLPAELEVFNGPPSTIFRLLTTLPEYRKGSLGITSRETPKQSASSGIGWFLFRERISIRVWLFICALQSIHDPVFRGGMDRRRGSTKATAQRWAPTEEASPRAAIEEAKAQSLWGCAHSGHHWHMLPWMPDA